MNLRNLQFSFVLSLVAMAMASAATAVQAGALATSSNAISAFQGTRALSGHFDDGFGGLLFPDNDVNADIDYAVFSPGKFDDFLTEFSIPFTHSVAPTDYVYAYQIHMLAPTTPKADIFSVGLVFSSGVQGTAPSFIPVSTYGSGTGGNGDIDPTGANGIPATEFLGGVDPTSSLWHFKSSTGPSSSVGTLDVGNYSALLFYSATNGPKFDSAQISAGLASGKSDLGDLLNTGVPVPAPEPSSLLMFALGSLGLFARGTRRV